MKTKGEIIYTGITYVQIKLDPRPLRNPTLIKAKLFFGKYRDGDYWHFLFSLPNHSKFS